MSPISIAELISYLEAKSWQDRFDGSALVAGQRLVSGRQLTQVKGEMLKTGDAELRAIVTEKDGTLFHPVLAIWRDGDSLTLEGDCRCAVGTNCSHAAALLLYLLKGKGVRIRQAFGETPLVERMTTGQTLSIGREESIETASSKRVEFDTQPSFLLRVRRRPDGERLTWLPEVFAEAWAVYGDRNVPLDPSGSLPPIVTPTEKIRRDRAAESQALNTLYALDLRPDAGEPPQSLRRLDRPDSDGPLWAPDREKWPHPEFYWKRFRHEGVAALERRRWEVRFAPDVGHAPLVFHTEGWRAEIVDEGKGWFHLSAGFEIDGERFELQPILAALVKNRFLESTAGMPAGQEFLVFLPDGRSLVLPVGRFRRILSILGELTEFHFSGPAPLRLAKLDALQVAEALSEESLPAEAPDELSHLAIALSEPFSDARLTPPSGLRAELRDYQRAGFRWMQLLHAHGLNGILADDMGLGKTLQTLAHILAEIESGRSRGLPSLVVAPTSVVTNWQREAAKFAPSLRTLILQGAQRHQRFRLIRECDLALTSYALLHRDQETLCEHEFHLLILDEAQYIKNPDAQVTQAAARLRSQHRLCLSGTPVENHLGELWSLFHFLMPGWLGSQETFRDTYRTSIEKNGNESKREALTRRVGPLILRRTKQEVAKELPPKTEILHPIAMGEGQSDLYETVRSTMDKHVRQALAMHGREAQIVFLDALLKLRQICCHPQLLHDKHADVASAKFEYLIDMLETLREEGHRTLLFSQFTTMLDLIEAHLVEQGIPYLKLTGATRDRQDLVERFQRGEGDVFLISLKAGGTGLTLTGADTVIHYDPWWNPAAENQATDRAYRIGQDKPVFVHKLICQNTVEERIQKMQEKKDDLASALLSGATTGLSLTPDTMADLLSAAIPES